MSARKPGSPSPRWGWEQALRLRQLVAAVWVASWLAIAPALLLLSQSVARGLEALPGGTGEVPAGDVELIIVEAVREAWLPLTIAVLCGLAVWWAWTVLWHAGVVRWQLRTGGQRVGLGDLLRPGLAAWWRYARLSATALVALAVAVAVVGIPVGWGVREALAAMAERRLIALLAAGAITGVVVVIVIWLATLHGAWLLGLPERRSAVVAWLRGLRTTVRRSLPSLVAWLAWVIPALVVSAVVPLLGAAFAGLRGGLLLVVVGLLASLARAFCWVGLFCSFAPVSGVVAAAQIGIVAAAEDSRRPRAETTEGLSRPPLSIDAPPAAASFPASGAEADERASWLGRGPNRGP